MKGRLSNAALAAIILVPVVAGILGVAVYVGYLSTLSAIPSVTVEYDGEFDDGFIATEYGFYADAAEQTDCNITSDVLGGSSYSACIYNASSPGFIANQSTKDWTFDYVVDIDGPVEDMDVDITLQNTGTLQAQDDIVIRTAELYRYEEGALYKNPLKKFSVEDNNYEVDDHTGPLMGDEYVLHLVLHTKTISPAAASGDDVMKIDLDLTTDGDTDAARILFESF
jgi:hypothetical protein